MPNRLPLCALLSTTALVALTFAPLPAAAACVDGGATLTCSGLGNAGVTSNTDNKSITVEADGAIDPASGRALTLSGDDQQVLNFGTIESLDDVAVRVRGARLMIDNAGTIRASDARAIRLQDGADDATIINRVGALIFSKEQAVRADSDDGGVILNIPNLRVENFGTIQSTEGRAIQSRGPGTTVINHGNLFGGEEVIEARLNFTLENHGTIRINDGVIDEDGVQFSSGLVDNWGLIQGSDDGVDVDEGLIKNHASGIIRVVPAAGEPGGNGIDADKLLQLNVSNDPLSDPLAGLLTIENAGTIEGPKAIGADEERTGAIDVINSGTLRGMSGVAIEFAPGMDASSLTLFDHSMIFGSVLMTDSDDTVTIGALQSGQFTDAFFDGRGGDDTVVLDGYDLSDVTRFVVSGNTAALTLATLAGNVRGEFRNFEFWTVGGTTLSTAQLSAVAPVPLPASALLLGAGLVGLRALRRRAA